MSEQASETAENLKKTQYADESQLPPPDPLEDIRQGVYKSRNAFVEYIQPFRADLFSYARSLTGSVWDTEDLVQESIMKALGNFGLFFRPLKNPKAYLFRVATNVWLDWKRKKGHLPMPEEEKVPAVFKEDSDAVTLREGLELILHALPPYQCAAFLLKDVFGFSIDDIADFMNSSSGAVKALLHRARLGLSEANTTAFAKHHAQPVSEKLLKDFVAAFNSRNIGDMLDLLLPTGGADIVGVYRDTGRQTLKGILEHTFREDGGPQAELVHYRGEKIILLVYALPDGDFVRDVVRLQEHGGKILWVNWYYYAPDVMEAVCEELNRPLKTQGYLYK